MPGKRRRSTANAEEAASAAGNQGDSNAQESIMTNFEVDQGRMANHASSCSSSSSSSYRTTSFTRLADQPPQFYEVPGLQELDAVSGMVGLSDGGLPARSYVTGSEEGGYSRAIATPLTFTSQHSGTLMTDPRQREREPESKETEARKARQRESNRIAQANKRERDKKRTQAHEKEIEELRKEKFELEGEIYLLKQENFELKQRLSATCNELSRAHVNCRCDLMS